MPGRTNVGKLFSLSIDANNAISFNGSNQLGTLLNYAALNSLADCTIEYWIYNQGANAGKSIFRLDDNPAAGNYFARDGFDGGGANTMNSAVYRAGSESYFGTIQGTAKIRASNTWEHNALVITSAVMSALKNGASVSADFNDSGSGAQGSSNGINLYLGNNGNGGSYSNIRIAAFRIWNYARTPAQTLADKPYYLDPTQETGLVLNCNFNEGSGATVANTVSGGNNMSLTNTPSWATGPSLTCKNYNGPRATAAARTTAGVRTVSS